MQNVENFIAQGVDAIVLKAVDKDASEPIWDACEAAGIPLVLCNSKINAEYTSYVGSDNYGTGEMQAEYIADLLGGEGKVAILMADLANMNAVERTEGAQDKLAEYPGIEIVEEQVANWMRDKGMEVAENWIQSGSEIDAIIANNDEMAIGAILAYEEAGVDVLIAGVGGTVEALPYIEAGDLAMSVFWNGYDQGYYGVDTAVRILNGEDVGDYVDVPVVVITQDNVDEYYDFYDFLNG